MKIDSSLLGRISSDEARKTCATTPSQSHAPEAQAVGGGVGDSVTLGKARSQSDAVYRMSEIKKKADQRVAEKADQDNAGESVTEALGDADRDELVAMAKLRMQTGFYQRADVIDEIARRISDKL